MTETCSNCRFFHTPPHGIKPVCRRYPPTLWRSPNRNDPLFSAFPTTSPTAWCGEWKRSLEDEAAANRKLANGPDTAIRALALARHDRKAALARERRLEAMT